MKISLHDFLEVYACRSLYYLNLVIHSDSNKEVCFKKVWNFYSSVHFEQKVNLCSKVPGKDGGWARGV